jgi:proteasome lid subunit RPN8/RPN11
MDAQEFRIRQAALEAIVAHAREDAPVECCGLLVGRGSSIEKAVRARNLSTSPTRFLIDPKDHIDARRAARALGVEVLGFYHSHPRSPAVPSPTDVAEAAFPEAVHLIVSLLDGGADARLFRIDGSSVVELPLISVASSSPADDV